MNRDILHRHVLSDGNAVWLQRTKLPGIRKPQWSLVQVTGQEFTDAPIITPLRDLNHGLDLLADILKADVSKTTILPHPPHQSRCNRIVAPKKTLATQR